MSKEEGDDATSQTFYWYWWCYTTTAGWRFQRIGAAFNSHVKPTVKLFYFFQSSLPLDTPRPPSPSFSAEILFLEKSRCSKYCSWGDETAQFPLPHTILDHKPAVILQVQHCSILPSYVCLVDNKDRREGLKNTLLTNVSPKSPSPGRGRFKSQHSRYAPNPFDI